MARPSTYSDDIPALLKRAQALAAKGFTDDALAEFLGVAPRTINAWKKKVDGFDDLLAEVKKPVDDQVETSLFQRALGFSWLERKVTQDGNGVTTQVIETTKWMPPDTTACIFWLKNRKPDDWKDVRERVEKHKLVDEDDVDITETARQLLFLFNQLTGGSSSITH